MVHSVNTGAAPQLEGQRLLAQRRGRIRTWMKEKPLQVNIVLAVLNVLYLALSTAFLLIVAVDEYGSRNIPLWFPLITFVLAVAFTSGIFFRQKYPISLLLIGAVADSVLYLCVAGDEFLRYTMPSATGMTGIIFLYSLAVKYNWGRILWSAGAYFLMTSTYIIVIAVIEGLSNVAGQPSPEDERAYYVVGMVVIGTSLLMNLFMDLAIILVARQMRKNKDFERELLASFDQNQRLAATEERTRIAREMHDVIAHSLTVMIALSDGARIVGKKNPERAEEVLAELSETGRSALADMRRTLGVLRDPGELSAPLIPAEGRAEDASENLAELVESFASTGLPAEFFHDGEPVPRDNNLRLSLYRIVQESLTNALRYGKNVRSVKVTLQVRLPDIWVTVVNDGTSALDQPPLRSGDLTNLGSGKGVAGMRERVILYGGELLAGPNDVGGWTVRAHLLWNGKTTTSSAQTN